MSEEMRFDGRVAIVTGAGRGIGREYALLLARRGASVVVNDFGGSLDGTGSSEDPARDVVAEIAEDGGRAVASTDSVASPEGAAAIVDRAISEFGQVDIVMCNAGVLANKPFGEHTTDDFRDVLGVHFFGTLMVIQHAWPHMIEAGYGRIVNTTSSGMFGWPENSTYGAAKGAILGLTNNLALEGAPHGIHANCISPSGATRMLDAAVPAEQIDMFKQAMPAALVAPVAAYLAHQDCELNAAVLAGGGGVAYKWVVNATKPLVNRAMTIEDVRDNLAQIRDEVTSEVVGPEAEIMQILAVAQGAA